MLFLFFFFGTKQTCLGLLRSKFILLFTVLTALEALFTVENLHAEKVEVTWVPMYANVQGKASFCGKELGQGGVCIFLLLLCGLRTDQG